MQSRMGGNRGFTLVELMVALVAGLIVSYAVVAFTMSSLKSNAEYVQSSRLTQSLRNSLDLVARELRRAGYDDEALATTAGATSSAFTPMLIMLSGTSPSNGSCAIYGYDRPGGTAGVVDVGNGEVRGLRRVQVTPTGATTSVGVIEYAVSTGTTRPTCAGDTADYTNYPPSCNTTSTWCPLTDPSTINIRGFTLTDTSATVGTNPSAVKIRNVAVAIQARLVGDDATSYLNGVSTSYKRGVATTVRVRSDCTKAAVANCNVSP